jgi:hypothetical protein
MYVHIEVKVLQAKLTVQRDFKDAELYLMRYQQCLTRSMTLIKIYFVNTIKITGQEVARKLSEKVCYAAGDTISL